MRVASPLASAKAYSCVIGASIRVNVGLRECSRRPVSCVWNGEEDEVSMITVSFFRCFAMPWVPRRTSRTISPLGSIVTRMSASLKASGLSVATWELGCSDAKFWAWFGSASFTIVR